MNSATFCIFEHIYFARPDSIVFGQTVHMVRQELGKNLAKEHPVEADFVCPIPDSGTSCSSHMNSKMFRKGVQELLRILEEQIFTYPHRIFLSGTNHTFSESDRAMFSYSQNRWLCSALKWTYRI